MFPSNLTYLVGNPPFLGSKRQNAEQKKELLATYDNAKNAGNIDYCAAWYMKAARFTLGKSTRCALVSTNSICQGEQVSTIWKPLHELGVHIDFAHTTFRWDNEAADEAQVFCIIVGFSREPAPKTLFIHQRPSAPEIATSVRSINAYLVDAPDAFIESRRRPICDVPTMGIGSQPIDGGFYLFNEEEMKEFLRIEPGASRFFHPWLGATEFLNGKKRWCLWLGDATFADVKNLPECRKRIDAVREFRLSSTRKSTVKAAETPQHFGTEIIAKETSVIFPRHSSERRKYIPLGFVTPDIFCGDANLLLPNASIYQFGVLQSQFHNAWMRRVCGRLKNDYRYSAGVVYNNFIWPNPSIQARELVESAAQLVLDARAAHSDATLADMYDPDNEPFFSDLMGAHRKLDAAVEAAYGVEFNGDENEIVAHLFGLYSKRIEG